jgi:hypothetical protein
MPTAPGPRFVLEAGFLVLLALVVGLADLDPLLVVLVMLVGWILASLIEFFAWRQSQSAIMRGLEPAFAGADVSEMAADDPPPPPPPPPPPEEETAVTPPAPEEPPEESEVDAPASEGPAPAEEEEEAESAKVEERRVVHRLEPLQPRPKRRWIFFGPRRREGQAEDDTEA